MDLCLLCDELQTNRSLKYGLENHVLFQTDNFFVVAAVGGFVEGYLMVCPKTHYASIIEMPSVDHPELAQVMQITRDILEKFYGPAVFFERGHGANHVVREEKNVEHAHIHAVPTRVDVATRLQQDFEGYAVPSYAQFAATHDRRMPYYFFETQRSERFAFRISDNVPSQTIRKIISEEENVQNWDWRIHPAVETVRKTVGTLQGRFIDTL